MCFVDITDAAENGILSTADYIANVLKAPIAANNLLDELEKIEHTLSETPYIYPKVPDDYLAGKGLHFVMVKNFILFYTINDEEQKVYVIRFLYGRRDWKNILSESH
jgi:plasmid stabilization system protein ParE